MKEKFYRDILNPQGLTDFQIRVKETDLWIAAERDLKKEAFEEVLRLRAQIEAYTKRHPEFLLSLSPLPFDPLAPPLIQLMLKAAEKTGVGPMAAVAGAISECLGRYLLKYSQELIVENGGDIFLRTLKERNVVLYAGNSPLSLKFAIRIPPRTTVGICTSSGTVGHSLSFGRADAVCVLSPSSALADAAATALGNLVQSPKDVPYVLKKGKEIEGIEGIVIIIGKTLGVWGKYEIKKV